MLRVRYLADFADDVAVTMSYISNICTGTPNLFAFLGFWGLMVFKQPLKLKDSLLLFQGNQPP